MKYKKHLHMKDFNSFLFFLIFLPFFSVSQEDHNMYFQKRIAEKLIGNDIKVHLIKDAGHGLSRTEDLEFISNVINGLIKKL